MKLKVWFIVSYLMTSASLPFNGNAAEVLLSAESLSNTSHISTLAASCAACHGTKGNSTGITPTLAGLDSGYFITQMLAFKDGERASTVMHRHAKGLNIDEINLLAHYFAQQIRATTAPPKAQAFKTNHDN